MILLKMLIWELLWCINGYTNHPAEAIWGAEDLGTILEYLTPGGDIPLIAGNQTRDYMILLKFQGNKEVLLDFLKSLATNNEEEQAIFRNYR